MCKGFKVICCECKKVLKKGPDDNVSHGYCEACSTKMLWMDGVEGEELTKFINRHEKVVRIEA